MDSDRAQGETRTSSRAKTDDITDPGVGGDTVPEESVVDSVERPQPRPRPRHRAPSSPVPQPRRSTREGKPSSRY